jgi:hypothetical protein
MIDDEFEVCFELMLSVVVAKRRFYRVSVRVYMPVPYPGGAIKKRKTLVRLYRVFRPTRTDFFLRPPDMELANKPAHAPSIGGVLQA